MTVGRYCSALVSRVQNAQNFGKNVSFANSLLLCGGVRPNFGRKKDKKTIMQSTKTREQFNARTEDWNQLIADLDVRLQTLASYAHVCPQELRRRYVMATLMVQAPDSADAKPTASADQPAKQRVTFPPSRANAPKYSCDIEAALAGDISDCDMAEQTDGDKKDERSTRKGSAAFVGQVACRPALIANNVERVLRYPIQRPLPPNQIHKVFVTQVERSCFYFRLAEGPRPACFDAVYADLGRLPPLHAIELTVGVPCVVLAQFDPHELTNDGKPREQTQFVTWARAAIDSVDKLTMKVTVRLVDSGRLLPNLHQTDIKPLPVTFDGPALAHRCVRDPNVHVKVDWPKKLSLVKLQVASTGDKSVAWCKTCKVVELQEGTKKTEEGEEKKESEGGRKTRSEISDHLSVSELTTNARDYIRMWLGTENFSSVTS